MTVVSLLAAASGSGACQPPAPPIWPYPTLVTAFGAAAGIVALIGLIVCAVRERLEEH